MNQELKLKLLDRKAVEVFFGGSKPLNASTVYRHIKAGRIPRPIKISAGCSRWSLAECEAALQRMGAVS
jgi:predicted DNA-binding transcriptional regulator AlpA